MQLAEMSVRAANGCSTWCVAAQAEERRVAEAALKTCEEIDQPRVRGRPRDAQRDVASLFRDEPDMRELIKLKAVYEQLESITDRCEDVANIVEGIVLENS